MKFRDRNDAGDQLAALLAEKIPEAERGQCVVYALPRGGVATGDRVAQKLHIPLDLLIVRKIGHPHNPEYALCVIGENGHKLCDTAELAEIDPVWLEKEIKKEQEEILRRKKAYAGGRRPISAEGKIAILVDDGIATGLTMRAAVQEIKHQRPKKIIVAVPFSPKETADVLRKEADELYTLEIPEFFLGAVGAYYENFPQLEDQEVQNIMKRYYTLNQPSR